MLKAKCFNILALCIFNVLFAVKIFAAPINEQHKFPFIGQIKTDDVNIRAGQSQNFEVLSKANRNDFIFVLDELYGWYKVKLPKMAHCYVAGKFIEKDGATGVSKVDRLNLRARPTKDSSNIGQLQKGDSVIILGEEANGWYQINPPQSCYGWIRADLVKYYSPIKDETDRNTAVSNRATAPVLLEPPIVQGKVQGIGFTLKKKPAEYKLMKDNRIICYLKSDRYNLRDFKDRDVFVWGNSLDTGYDKPVVNATKIQPIE